MFSLKQIKFGFQLLAFLIFLFQMIQAVIRYLDFPIIQENSALPRIKEALDSGKMKPIVYICEESQFSYLKV